MHGRIEMGKIVLAGLLCGLFAAAIPAQDAALSDLFSAMTLDQKLGQMHIIGFQGRELNPEAEALIRDHRLGGYFLQVSSNYTFPDELARLSATVQAAAADLPLLVALDQEGGVTAPIHFMMGATGTPGNMALGASGREEDTYDAYRALGTDMRACGANLNFAPAIDVLFEPANPGYNVRAFSSSVALNARLAPAAISGLQDAGVLACAKRFPGLVTFAGDSHTESVHITLGEAELLAQLEHFRAAIAAGADMIMTSHAFVDAWDKLYPVTLSKKCIGGMLRGELGYDGLVITDAMGMAGISKHHSHGEATVLAVAAGCDLVLQVSPDVQEFQERIQALRTAVEMGRLSEEQIDQSVLRILAAKKRAGLFENSAPDTTAVFEAMAPKQLVQANQRAALNGIVLVRDEAGLLPLPLVGKQIVVVCPPSIYTDAGNGTDQIPAGYTLGHYVRKVVPEAVEVPVDTLPSAAEAEYALERAEAADVLVVATLFSLHSPDQVDLVKKLLNLGKPTVLLSLGTPADLAPFPEAGTAIAVNSPAPVSLAAAVRVLFGEAEAGGTLPMPISPNSVAPAVP